MHDRRSACSSQSVCEYRARGTRRRGDPAGDAAGEARRALARAEQRANVQSLDVLERDVAVVVDLPELTACAMRGGAGAGSAAPRRGTWPSIDSYVNWAGCVDREQPSGSPRSRARTIGHSADADALRSSYLPNTEGFASISELVLSRGDSPSAPARRMRCAILGRPYTQSIVTRSSVNHVSVSGELRSQWSQIVILGEIRPCGSGDAGSYL